MTSDFRKPLRAITGSPMSEVLHPGSLKSEV